MANVLPADQDETLALVLSGGGARASYQVGVLQAIAERYPDLKIPILAGVSAGALNTVYLASHPGPFARAVASLLTEWQRLSPGAVYEVRPMSLGRAVARWALDMVLQRRTGPPAMMGLMSMNPLRRFLHRCIEPNGIRRNIEAGWLRAAALSATCYNTGQTVTFVQGVDDLTLWERHMRVAVRQRLGVSHLMASAAIPLVFPAVRLGDAFYGDGSVRQTAPLAPAIHLGARRILAVAMRAERSVSSCEPSERQYPVAAEVFGLLLHSVFLDSLDADAERLERINRLLAALPPDSPAAAEFKTVKLLLLRPSRDLGQLARHHALDLPPLIRFLVASIGGQRARSPDFLSYLMFQPAFTGTLIELGYEDTRRRIGAIEEFLGR